MLEDQGITTGLTPIGGWRYEQPYKGAIQRIPPTNSFNTGPELVEAVRDFRAVHGMSLGDPERDVAEFIKNVSAINNRFPGKKRPEPQKTGFRPLIERVRAWLDTMSGRRPKLVGQHDATQRAEICAKCPQNVKWRTKCGPCNEEVDNRGMNLRRVAVFKPGDELKACRLHDIHLPSAIFLDIEALPARNPEAPADCWIP